jgi:hypothetical protein
MACSIIKVFYLTKLAATLKVYRVILNVVHNYNASYKVRI